LTPNRRPGLRRAQGEYKGAREVLALGTDTTHTHRPAVGWPGGGC
jgi:hypothetical protein